MLIVIICLLIVQLLYIGILFRYYFSWKQLIFADSNQVINKIPDSDSPFVSVVIPVRDEEENIEKLLNSLAHQNYSAFEIIVVNDHSEDETLKAIELSNIPCRLFNLSKSSGKKAALTEGINNAKGKWIITLDGDVTIDSNLITRLISMGINSDAVMVCGMVILQGEKDKNNFLSRFQTMEFGILQFCGMAALYEHNILVNSGANLAFRKDAWEKVGGYENHISVASGDDSFLMFDLDKEFPGRISASADAVVTSATVPTFKELLNQRIRWAGKTKHYDNRYVKQIGAIVLLSAIGFILMPILFVNCSGISSVLLAIYTSIVSLRIVSEIILLKSWSGKYDRHFSITESILMSLVHPFFIGLLLVLQPFNKSVWKGRKL